MAFANSYPLPHPFPPGKVWAAVKHGEVKGMAYMDRFPEDEPFHRYRQRVRGELAELGKVLTGEVRDGRFWLRLDDAVGGVLRGGDLNTARVVRHA